LIFRLSVGSWLILTEGSSYLLSAALHNKDQSIFWLFAIKVIFTHLIITKNFFFSWKLVKTDNRDKIVNILFSLLLLITLNFHFNEISKFIKSSLVQVLIMKILSNFNIIFYWSILLPTSLIIFEILSYTLKIKQIIKRKLFHLLALLIYIPGIKYMDTDLLLLISLIITYLFILIEIIRNKIKTNILINKLNFYLIKNIDDRDHEKFILTHLFLLFGCYSSLLFSEIEKDQKYLGYVGLVILGVGDSMASVIGSKFGQRKIFPPTNKTLEGTISAVLSTIFILMSLSSEFISIKTLISITLIFLYEGFTLEIDNLVLPLISYKIFKVLN
jgi:dolichol kinase